MVSPEDDPLLGLPLSITNSPCQLFFTRGSNIKYSNVAIDVGSHQEILSLRVFERYWHIILHPILIDVKAPCKSPDAYLLIGLHFDYNLRLRWYRVHYKHVSFAAGYEQ